MSDELKNKDNSSNDFGTYSMLVLKELEKLNEKQDYLAKSMTEIKEELTNDIYEIKNDITKVKAMQYSLNELKEFKKKLEEKSIVTKVEDLDAWKDKVSEVWSPTQMQDAKKQVYQQKGKWIALLAIVGTLQVLIGLAIKFL